MEKAAAGANAGSGWEKKKSVVHCLAVALGCALGHAALAQELAAPLQAAVEAARGEPPLRVELRASELPRLDSDDLGFQAPRVDLSLLPGGQRPNAFGVLAGLSGYAPRTGLQPWPPLRPALDVGVQWRHTFENSRQIDITAWRRMAAPDVYTLTQQQPLYAARVEVTLAPAKSPLLTGGGLIGLQLQGNARISIKRSNGGPMIYYRNTF